MFVSGFRTLAVILVSDMCSFEPLVFGYGLVKTSWNSYKEGFFSPHSCSPFLTMLCAIHLLYYISAFVTLINVTVSSDVCGYNLLAINDITSVHTHS